MSSLLRIRPTACPNWQRTLRACLTPFISRSLSSESTSRNGRSCRIAVIGSGPAGFYTAYRAMSKIHDAKVDMYEALPVPFGLVRFGVAPDHPEVKNCQEKFEEVASSPNFTFIGNVSVGNPSDHPNGASIPLDSLMRHYHAVVFAYGASQDRTLNIPGESLSGVYSAREFVGWYNGLPEHASLNPDLTRGDTALVIGQGNVALDVARMLLSDLSTLRKTDISAHALDTLATSKIKRVHIIGRRGPMQAAFTIKEVRELMNLPSVGFHPVPDPHSLIPSDLSTIPRARRRLMDILLRGSPHPLSSPSTEKSWSLDFCLSPTSFQPSPTSPSHLSSTVLSHTTLTSPFSPSSPAIPSPSTPPLTIPTHLAFRSIGYRAAPLYDFSTLNIPFDSDRGVILHDGFGRVEHPEREPGAAVRMDVSPGLYCSGWVKTGPTGVIASTMGDAFATGDVIAGDWARYASGEEGGKGRFLNEGREEEEVMGWQAVKAEAGLGGKEVLGWEDWRRIDGAERERGERKGKVREKFTGVEEMLGVVR